MKTSILAQCLLKKYSVMGAFPLFCENCLTNILLSSWVAVSEVMNRSHLYESGALLFTDMNIKSVSNF